MARRSKPPAQPRTSLLKRINAVFDKTANPDANPINQDPAQEGEEGEDRPAKRRKRKTNVVPDDEEMEEATGGGGGEFIVEEGGGGGFLMDVDEGGGGFMPEDDYDAGAGGGFLPDDDSAAPLPSPPSLPPRNRIPLHRIPYALAALNLPSDRHELLQLFESAASEDDEGVNSVSREHFIQACEVLLDDDDDDDEEEEDQEEEASEESDDLDSYVAEDKGKGKGKKTARRRSTRSNPATLTAPLGHDDNDNAIVIDDESSDLSELESGDGDGVGTSAGKSAKGKKTAATTSKGKGKAKAKGEKKSKWKDRERVLNAQEMRDAQDTFDLFFEGSSKSDNTATGSKRTIQIQHLRSVVKLIGDKTKFKDEDLVEMLDYAGRSAGVVDLAAFTKIMAEVGV